MVIPMNYADLNLFEIIIANERSGMDFECDGDKMIVEIVED